MFGEEEEQYDQEQQEYEGTAGGFMHGWAAC